MKNESVKLWFQYTVMIMLGFCLITTGAFFSNYTIAGKISGDWFLKITIYVGFLFLCAKIATTVLNKVGRCIGYIISSLIGIFSSILLTIYSVLLMFGICRTVEICRRDMMFWDFFKVNLEHNIPILCVVFSICIVLYAIIFLMYHRKLFDKYLPIVKKKFLAFIGVSEVITEDATTEDLEKLKKVINNIEDFDVSKNMYDEIIEYVITVPNTVNG